MKVNILVPNGGRNSGGGRIIADYAQFLSSQGHQVVAYVADYGSNMQKFSDRFIFRRQFGAVPITSLIPNSPCARRFDGFSRIRPSDIEDGDLVISTWWETAEWMKQLPQRKGKQIHFVQGHEVFPFLPQDRTRAVYARSDIKITVSSWLRDVLLYEYGQSSELVLNGVDTSIFHSHFRLTHSSIKVGFLWSQNLEKNMARSISAVCDAKDALPALRVQVFGAHSRPKELPSWIEYEALPSQVRIIELYSQCDAWLFSSDAEGFGLPILEAMACGTPVLATRAGAATDLVVDGVNGRLLPFCAEAFRNAILELADMPFEKHTQWSVAARRTAEDHDIKNSRARFEDVLERILARS